MLMLNNDLHIFITAAQTGSLTEAAKKLYVSQLAIRREELSYAYIENVVFWLYVLSGTENTV